jgi:hypothetical protein
MTKIDTALSRIRSEQADARAAKAKADKKCKHAISALSTWDNQAAARDARRQYEATAAHEKAQIERDHTARIGELRREATAALEADRDALEADRYRHELTQGPQGAQEWSEAAARAAFIREDLAAMPARDYARHYQRLTAAGDTVAAHLVQRYGLRRIDDEITARIDRQEPTLDWHMARRALEEATAAPSNPALDKRSAGLREAERELEGVQTQGETQAIYDQFGIRATAPETTE